MARISITFTLHETRGSARFKCKCGARFSRSTREAWTENPYHAWQGREHELDNEQLAKVKKKLAKVECPKCGSACKPGPIVFNTVTR